MQNKINGAAIVAFIFFTNLTTYNAVVGNEPGTVVFGVGSFLSAITFFLTCED